MGSNVFSPMAIDAIGEIFNISLGSSATAVSNMLARRVDITTPTVSVVSAKDFTLGDLQPAIGVKIDYVAGLSGSNIMLLKRSDVRAIVDILMGSTTKDEDFEINELNMSAICEVMNQMMGAASTAMSDFLNRMVNISTPQAFEIGSLEEFVEKYFPSNGILVVVRFKFSIEDAVESEFMSALSMDLVRELLKGFGIEDEDVGMGAEPEPEPAAQPAAAAEPESSGGSGASLSQEEIEKLMAQNFAEEQAAQQNASPQPAASAEQPAQPQVAATPAPQQPVAAAPAQQTPVQQPVAQAQQGVPQAMPQISPEMQQQYAAMPYPPYGMQMPYPPYYMPPQQQAAPEPKTIKTTKPAMPKFEEHATSLNEEQEGNLDLLMSVPVDVAVEIGRTRRRVKDILNYTKGSLVVLDRLAGDRADLYVNGKCIAKGDIVVVDDNFGLRIAEIIEPLALEDL
ncbi:flagellar motor switch phosphatase FliY [Agathobaculum sp. LCP25S3_E8]|uniref:flagellar motor switch phosphatase FliY n=1 Tax=Agathobaculum sp. LCP25S3_E8 TaxID=3438735 RepID=UPI003F8EC2B9